MKLLLFLTVIIALASTQCPSPNVSVGSLCLSQTDAQACFDHLDNLSADTTENPSISNVCEDFVYNNQQRYKFTVSYNDPYSHNSDCNTQELEFEGTPLNNGNGDLNEWEFDPNNQTIVFNIAHADIDDPNKYNCLKETNDDEYIWQCEMELNILLGGVEQLTYQFHIVIILDRVYENVLTIDVVKNEVVGDCCENELHIDTILKFCETFACDAYLDDGLVVQRKQDVFVEHSIVSPEFQYYYLNGLTLKLGPFIPDIIATNGSQQARYIWHFQSNIALPGMTLEAISRISESPSARRRLQESDVGDDYKVKGTATISIEELNKKQDQLESEKKVNGVLIGIIATVSALVLLAMVGAGIYCLKVRKAKGINQPEQKYEEKQGSTLSVESV